MGVPADLPVYFYPDYTCQENERLSLAFISCLQVFVCLSIRVRRNRRTFGRTAVRRWSVALNVIQGE